MTNSRLIIVLGLGLVLLAAFWANNDAPIIEQRVPGMMPPPQQQPVPLLQKDYDDTAKKLFKKDAQGIRSIDLEIPEGPVFLPVIRNRNKYVNYNLRPTGHPVVFNVPGTHPYYPGGYYYRCR